MDTEVTSRLDVPEFFNGWVVLSIALFGLNNFYLKAAVGNWFTGKLSDLLVCFFLPLFISALLAFVGVAFKPRLWLGLLLTAIALVLVKTSSSASDALNLLLTELGHPIGLGRSHNIADSTDLVALPVLFLTYKFALLHGGNAHERQTSLPKPL